MSGDEAEPTLPLDGVCVLDMTQVWAGPMVTRMLANLGATVLKVESPGRPDTLRVLGADLPQRFPDGEPGPDPENRNAWFNTQNPDKLGVVIDVKHPEGRKLVESLARHCQILVSNSRGGVMDRLGLGHRRYRELRGPDAIVVEMSAFGSTGERAHLAGFGAQFEAASGAPWLIGGPDSPTLTGFAFADAVGGLATATAVATALHEARSTGKGAYIDTSLVESYLSVMGDVLLEASVFDAAPPGIGGGADPGAPGRGGGAPGGEVPGGEEPGDRAMGWGGNRHPEAAPHGIYPLAEGLGQLAVGVVTDDQWRALAALLADPELADPALEDRANRITRRDWIDRRIADWTGAHRDGAELARRLQAAGVAAAPVADSAQLAGDPTLCASGFYTALEHPSAGRHRYPGMPYLLDGRRVPPRAPAPRWGEHTGYVLREFLGLGADRLGELEAAGVIVCRTGARLQADTGW